MQQVRSGKELAACGRDAQGTQQARAGEIGGRKLFAYRRDAQGNKQARAGEIGGQSSRLFEKAHRALIQAGESREGESTGVCRTLAFAVCRTLVGRALAVVRRKVQPGLASLRLQPHRVFRWLQQVRGCSRSGIAAGRRWEHIGVKQEGCWWQLERWA